VAIPVTSTVVDPDARRSRDGVTNVNSVIDVPGIAPAHLIANIDRTIDRIGAGRSTVRWTLEGVAAGTPFSLMRENRFAAAPDSAADIATTSSQELAQQLTAIIGNSLAEVTLGRLRIDAGVADQYRAYRVDRLERRAGATWVPINPSVPVRLAAGQALRLRAHLRSYRRRTPDRVVELILAVPSELPPGTAGTLVVRGVAEEPDAPSPGGPDGPGGPAEPETFDALLTSLRDAPRNDEVIAELLLGEQPTPAARARERVDEVVTGSVLIPVEGPPEPAPPARR
jgi:hypothetical protein